MADMNRGLDLSVFDSTTDSESDQFRSFYAEKLGTPHRGLNFWLDPRGARRRDGPARGLVPAHDWRGPGLRRFLAPAPAAAAQVVAEPLREHPVRAAQAGHALLPAALQR